VIFEGRIGLKIDILKKDKQFEWKLLEDSNYVMYKMEAIWWKPKRKVVVSLVLRLVNPCVYMKNFCRSPAHYHELETLAMRACGTVIPR